MRYSAERKEAVLKKMLPPHNRWRKAARREGRLLPDGDRAPAGWTSKDNFAAVVESAALNATELGAYCRQRGLYPEQIQAWRAACEQAADWDQAQAARLQQATREAQRRIQALERELTRKDQALAETAALLVLRKKAAAIWGDGAAV